jgi:TM2 domain-containing membrane protein YozV
LVAVVGQGRITLVMAWWPIPAALLLLAVVMIIWRMRQIPGPVDLLWAAFRRILPSSRERAV